MTTSVRLIDNEPLFKEDADRLAILPIRFPEIWRFYKRLQSNTWTAEEITFKDDISQIKNGDVKEDILNVVEFILGFFSGADKIVNENLAKNFLDTVKIMEAEFFYGQQIQNENVHNETYSVTIDTYYKDDPERKHKILNAVQTMPCIQKLFKWAQKWVHRTAEDELRENAILQDYERDGVGYEELEDLAYIWSKGKLLVAFACVEGILFSAAFCILFWIKEQGILPGLTFSNELISVDEGMHRDFACLLYRMINNKPPAEQIEEIIREAVEFEKEFVKEMLAKNLTGMNAVDMAQYVEFTADSLSKELGYESIYSVKNPFPFMDKISFNGITNFFEKRVAEYSLSGFEEGNDDELDLNDDY